MGTGIFRLGVGLVALTLSLAGCGGSSSGTRSGGSSVSGPRGGFSWLHPQAPPAGWRVVRIPTGATMAYPPNWQRQHSDAGTATAVLRAPDGTYLGYVNLTPRQGEETLSDWASFRIEHNTEEGDRHVERLAAASGLHFLAGHGSCVMDAYTTQSGGRYTEVACLVTGRRADSVIVVAAPAARWASDSATLERAIEGVRS